MDKYESLSHTKWEFKYHVVFIPKCRRRTLYEQLGVKTRGLPDTFAQIVQVRFACGGKVALADAFTCATHESTASSLGSMRFRRCSRIGAMQLPIPDLRRPLQRKAVVRSSQAYTLSLPITPDT